MINFFRKTRKKLADTNRPMKYFRYAVGEIVLVVIGILIALQINNWNEGRLNDKNVQAKLNVVYQELIKDIEVLEKHIELNKDRSQLIFRSLEIIERETSLSKYNRQVLDSAFDRYKWLDPLYNNTRSYEEFLLTESNIINVGVYSELNEYLDIYTQTNGRVKRFSETINQANYDIETMPSLSRKNSGEFIYLFRDVKSDKNLFEAIRIGKTYFEVTAYHYILVLEKARDLESEILYEQRKHNN